MPGFFDQGDSMGLIGTNVGIVDKEIVAISTTNDHKVSLVGPSFASDCAPVDRHAHQVTLIKVSKECGKVGGLDGKKLTLPHGLDHPVKTGKIEKLDLVFIVFSPPTLKLVGIFGTGPDIVRRIDVGGDAIMIEEESKLGRKSVLSGEVMNNSIYFVKVGGEVGTVKFNHHCRTGLTTLEATRLDVGKVKLHGSIVAMLVTITFVL